MTRYAKDTRVSSEASRAEIERVLRRYGATAFASGWDSAQASVMFEMRGRRIRLTLPLPDRADRRFTHTEARGQLRSVEAQERQYEQAVRQSWRALVLLVKGKLEGIESGITTLESEFLANVVLPNGATVGEWAAPQLELAYRRNEMPALLPGVAEPGEDRS